MRDPPHDLVTSQRPHLQILPHWHWSFNIGIWGRTQTFHLIFQAALFLSKFFPLWPLWCHSQAAKGYLVCSLPTGRIYYSTEILCFTGFGVFFASPPTVALPNGPLQARSLFHTVSYRWESSPAPHYPANMKAVDWELTDLFSYSHHACTFLLPYPTLLKNVFIQSPLLLSLCFPPISK